MAFDKYVKLPGSERPPMPGTTKTGSCDPNQLMHVTVVLRPRSAGKNQPEPDKSSPKANGLRARSTRRAMAPIPPT